MITTQEVLELIASMSKPLGLDPKMAQAIALTETNAKLFLVRYEPLWPYFSQVDIHAARLGISIPTEKVLQAMSYGPLQIMGSVARELAYTEMLTQLNLPEDGIRIALLKLQTVARRYKKLEDVFSAWNAGTPVYKSNGGLMNQSYVDKANAFYKTLTSPA